MEKQKKNQNKQAKIKRKGNREQRKIINALNFKFSFQLSIPRLFNTHFNISLLLAAKGCHC